MLNWINFNQVNEGENILNYKKLILVGFISAFVAILTSVMGVTGTIIGSVISSVLYNMLTEALDKPVGNAKIKASFEWDIAYIFPIAVIALIQLLLIFALLSESGILPPGFLFVYMSLQDFANNNLYRLLGIALIVISAYPIILKPDFVKREHGVILVFVALIFLARGFVDLGNVVTDIYDDVFIYFDLPIAVVAFVLLAFVIVRILMSATRSSNDESIDEETFNTHNVRRVRHTNGKPDYNHEKPRVLSDDYNKFKKSIEEGITVEHNPADASNHPSTGINKSSKNIQFESNDLLDDYKK